MTFGAPRPGPAARRRGRRGRPTTASARKKRSAHVVRADGRMLLVQKTRLRQSFFYFIAAKLLREAGLGPASWSARFCRSCATKSPPPSVWASPPTPSTPTTRNTGPRSSSRSATTASTSSSPERFRTEVLAALAPRIALLVVPKPLHLRLGPRLPSLYRLVERIDATLLLKLAPNAKQLALRSSSPRLRHAD